MSQLTSWLNLKDSSWVLFPIDRCLAPLPNTEKKLIMKTPVDGSSINTIVFHGVCCRRAIAFSFCLLCFLALKCNLHDTGRSQSACSSGRKWRKKLWMGTKLTVQQCKRVDVIAPAWGGHWLWARASFVCLWCCSNGIYVHIQYRETQGVRLVWRSQLNVAWYACWNKGTFSNVAYHALFIQWIWRKDLDIFEL